MNIYYYSQRKSSRRKEVEYKTFKVMKCEQKTWALNSRTSRAAILNIPRFCVSKERWPDTERILFLVDWFEKYNVRLGNVQCQKNVFRTSKNLNIKKRFCGGSYSHAAARSGKIMIKWHASDEPCLPGRFTWSPGAAEHDAIVNVASKLCL